MDSLVGISESHIGILVWLLWTAVGVAEALFVARISAERNCIADIVTAVIAANLGGYFSLQFVGDTSTQRILISFMSAVFFSALSLWMLGWLMKPHH